MERKTAFLNLHEVQRSQTENEYEATFLSAGTHPVSGYPHGLTFLAEDIARGAESMNGQPVNLDHDTKHVESEVGFVKPDSVKVVEGRLRGTIVLNPSTARFAVAKAFIENRQRAGKAPEVSVGVLFAEERLPNGATLARDLAFDHLALVVRGACSPERGCGVGLSKETTIMDDTTPTPETQGEAPAPAGEAPPATAPDTAAAETPPCGCLELEASLLAEKEAHKATRAELDTRTADLEARLEKAQEQVIDTTKRLADLEASLPERLAVLAKAQNLGLELTGTEDLGVMRADLAKAEKVAAHLAKAPAAPATGPSKGAELAKPTDPVGARAAALLRAGGMNL